MLVLIDGHNLIAKMPGINLDDADDEERLLVKLRQYRARTRRKITVVFDPGPAFNLASKRSKGGITIQYAGSGKTADDVIINRLRKARNPKQILVVTSDQAIERVARQVQARVMSSTDFAQALNAPPAGTKTKTEVSLSKEEVDEWLAIFNNKQD
jgi:hypothetical protein